MPSARQSSRSGERRGGPNVDLGGQRAMHRAFIGDLHEPRALRLVERPFEHDGALYAIDLALLGLAARAVGGVNLGVGEPYRHPIERKSLVLGIKSQRHR